MGKKPFKYFCGLEDSNFSCKIIPKIQKYNGDILTNQTVILKEVEHLYSKLFKEHVIPEDIHLENYVDSSIIIIYITRCLT